MNSLLTVVVVLSLGCSSNTNNPSPKPIEDTQIEAQTDSATTPTEEALDHTVFSDPSTCAPCHPNQYEQWRTSMHSYAALSPVFDAMAAKAFRDTSGEIGTFCTGCHSPLGTYEGEEGWTTAADRSEKSRQGVSCDFCHSATNHTGILGNANLEASPSSVKYGSNENDYEGAHSTEKSDFLQSPELCGSCHDVFMFPGIQIEQAYTEYTESPAALAGVRCQDCHMGTEPGVVSPPARGPAAIVDGVPGPDRTLSNHRFVGPDYSLIDEFPYPNDLEASAQAQAETLLQIQTLLENAAELDPLIVSMNHSTQSAQIEVTVRSLTTGHRVPTGFTSERQMWVAVTAWDRNANVVFQSGDLDSYGDLRDAHSWDVKTGAAQPDSALVNFQSENITNRREWTDRDAPGDPLGDDTFFSIFPFDALAIVRHSLKPLEERELTYRLLGIRYEDLGRIEVTLNYRNLPPYLLRSLQLESLVERLVVFEIDSKEIVF